MPEGGSRGGAAPLGLGLSHGPRWCPCAHGSSRSHLFAVRRFRPADSPLGPPLCPPLPGAVPFPGPPGQPTPSPGAGARSKSAEPHPISGAALSHRCRLCCIFRYWGSGGIWIGPMAKWLTGLYRDTDGSGACEERWPSAAHPIPIPGPVAVPDAVGYPRGVLRRPRRRPQPLRSNRHRVPAEGAAARIPVRPVGGPSSESRTERPPQRMPRGSPRDGEPIGRVSM